MTKAPNARREDCSIIALDKFIQATRDSGYKGTASAISELVDNSIQAGATRIAISVEARAGGDEEKAIEVSVLDNGCGMDPGTLRQALRFGGSTRFGDRRGLGRYGMGLPNASLSQARRVTVYTWQSTTTQRNSASEGCAADPRVHSSYLDVDEIVRREMTEVPAPEIVKSPPSACAGNAGTLVAWSRCDRLDNRRVSTIVRKLEAELGRRFRHFIWKGLRITINGDTLEAFDPLYLNPKGEFSGAPRAKLTAPTPADASKWTQLNDRLRVHHTRQHLLVTNRGPREEGYTYCTKCGLIEPTASPKGAVGAAHRKPYPDMKEPMCPGGGATTGLVLGTDFITDVLLVAIRVDAPLTLIPGVLATDVALRTICEALTKAACARLELEANELQAEYRPALTPEGRAGLEAEIYIYDTLPGGAGFAKRVGEIGLPVFEDALKLLEECPDNCDRSCYRCLRSYKNKFEHDLLDRHLGASLLRFALYDAAPTLSPGRVARSTDLLFEDLDRQGIEGLSLERDKQISVAGLGDVVAPILVTNSSGARFAIGLHGPLTPNEPTDADLKDIKEYATSLTVHLEDELVVRRNLPFATQKLIEKLG